VSRLDTQSLCVDKAPYGSAGCVCVGVKGRTQRGETASQCGEMDMSVNAGRWT
jgi:hypothetical protein